MSGGLILTSEGDVGSGDSGGGSAYVSAIGLLVLIGMPFSWTTKELRGSQQKQVFHQRFTSDPRGVSKDLLRRRGTHYRWTKKMLKVPASMSVAFDCSLAERHPELKTRLKKAKSLKSEDSARVNQLLQEVYRAAKKRSEKFDVCRLKVRYFQDPKTFKRAVLGQYRKGVKRSNKHIDTLRWIMNTYLDMTGADTRYMTCQLKADRARLTVAFQQIEKPVTRKAGFETLNHLLRRAKSFGELPIIKRTQCWKTGKSLQTQ